MQNLSLNSILKKANYHRPLLFNGILWSLAFVILLFIFSKGKSPIHVDYAYTITFLSALAVPVLINFYVLIPTFLKHEKYLIYSLTFLINLIVFAYLSSYLLKPVLDLVFPNYFFISYLSQGNIFLVFTIFLIVSTLLKLAEDWFYFNTNQNKLLRLKNQQIETQLSALRGQINPHFLFNSLNVIYALALEKKGETTKAIVQLSDILRYIIYDSDTQGVALKDEITLLKNYIAFQNHRVETHIATEFKIDIENEDFKIYPMLLLPLLENSYKHGVISGEANAPIKMMLQQKEHHFIFTLENANLNTNNKIEAKHSGVDLENIRNNLNLVYPKRHEFSTEIKNNTFKVRLTIKNES
jgi:sensor histidine kinase YesM